MCCFAHTQDSITPIPHICESVKDSNFQSPSPLCIGFQLAVIIHKHLRQFATLFIFTVNVTSYYQLPTLNGRLYRFVQPLVEAKGLEPSNLNSANVARLPILLRPHSDLLKTNPRGLTVPTYDLEESKHR